jgi:hypothetical protein
MPTVIIRNCNSHVPNDILPSGCSIADLLQQCRMSTTNQHDYLACVYQVVADLRAQGVITGMEASKILKCASRGKDHDSHHDHHSSRDDHSDGGGTTGHDHGSTRGRRDDASAHVRNHGQRGNRSF